QLAIRRVEEDLGRPIHAVFSQFDPVPLASASIGQVHRARLHDGREAIVKIQRPDIQAQIEVDMDILRALARLAEKYREEVRHYNPQAIVSALERTMELELDFKHELANIRLFRKNAAARESQVIIPEPFEEYSSSRVLTMEYVEGFKINDLEAYVACGISPEKVAMEAMNSFFEQVFVDGFFHADPHPGNVLVDKGGKLVYLDFGMMGKLPQRDKELLGDLFVAVELRDSESILQAMKSLSKISYIENEQGLLLELDGFLNSYYSADLQAIPLSEVLEKFRSLVIQHNLHIPADFFLLIKALSSMEGNVRLLHPEIPLFHYLKPHAEKLIMRKMNPFRQLKSLYLTLFDFGELLHSLPGDTRKIIQKLKHGSLKVEIEHKGLSELRVSLEEISNRIALSILIASMIIGSSLIVHAKIPPFVNGIPILGLIGFILAVVLAIFLIISIVRSGKR